MSFNIAKAYEDNAGGIFIACAGNVWDVSGVIGERTGRLDMAAVAHGDTKHWTVPCGPDVATDEELASMQHIATYDEHGLHTHVHGLSPMGNAGTVYFNLD